MLPRLRPHLRLSLLAIALALAACARSAPPAPVAYGHAGQPMAAPAPIPSPPQGTTPHPDSIVVRPGETLYAVSRRYDVPVRSIIEANNLAPPYRLLAGTRLKLPQLRYHMVRPGETLYGVSRLYGVDASTLARSNHLAPPYTIKVGVPLILPAPVEQAPAAATPPTEVASVKLPPPVPAGRNAATAPAAAASSAPPQAAPAPAAEPASPAPPPATAAPPPEARTASLPPPAPVPPPGGKGLIWPVQGRLVAGYGPGPGGTHNDGINIAAPEGTPVLAAGDGEVAYAGNELRGYGWLVLLKHPKSGLMTAYAHNSLLLVKRGDKVRRGQPIARVGATGTVGEPQLHFEIRKGTRALDPAEYLPAPPATAAASG